MLCELKSVPQAVLPMASTEQRKMIQEHPGQALSPSQRLSQSKRSHPYTCKRHTIQLELPYKKSIGDKCGYLLNDITNSDLLRAKSSKARDDFTNNKSCWFRSYFQTHSKTNQLCCIFMVAVVWFFLKRNIFGSGNVQNLKIFRLLRLHRSNSIKGLWQNLSWI